MRHPRLRHALFFAVAICLPLLAAPARADGDEKVEGDREVPLECADFKDSRTGGVGFALAPVTKLSIRDLRVKHLDKK
jgi:hypothetical protein